MNNVTNQNGRIDFAKTLVQGRLHTAAGDKRCGCGPCAHWVTLAARRAGITRAELEGALAPVAQAERRQARTRRASSVRICDTGTISVRGRDIDDDEALAILLARLHDSG